MNQQQGNGNAAVMEVKPTSPSTIRALSLLANQTRLDVLASLGRCEKPVSGIIEELGLDSPIVSRALRELRKANLVSYEVVKTRHIYRLSELVTVEFVGSKLHMEVATTTGSIVIHA